jgi:DNA polymerase III sliding clamp (beta) subunit (PCNA family)
MKTKFMINALVLIHALEFAKKAMEKNPVVPILENFLLYVCDGVLKVLGSTLQSTCACSIPVEASKDTPSFTLLLPLPALAYLKKIGNDLITVVYDPETFSIEILDSDGRAKYSSEDIKDFPKMPVIDQAYKSFPAKYLDELGDLLTYTSKDDLRPAMTGINFGYLQTDYKMTATNGHVLKLVTVPELQREEVPVIEVKPRFEVKPVPDASDNIKYLIWDTKESDYYKESRWNSATEEYDDVQIIYDTQERAEEIRAKAESENKEVEYKATHTDFILPRKTANILAAVKASEDLEILVRYDETTAQITNALFQWIEEVTIGTKKDKHTIFVTYEVSSRTIDERYPDFHNVIPEATRTVTRLTAPKDDFLKLLDKAEMFANRTTHQVRIKLNGCQQLSSEDLDFSNEYCANIPGTYSGEEMEIGFNAEFLNQCISSFGKEFTLELIAPNKAAVIRDETRLALVMPVMLNQYV